MMHHKIAIVLEAPEEDDAREGLPLQSGYGDLLKAHMRKEGIEPDDCLITHVFPDRPEGDDPGNNFLTKIAARREGVRSKLIPFRGRVLEPRFEKEIHRLRGELVEFKPNIVICLGAYALWALTGYNHISKYRGAVMQSRQIAGFKMIATYSPSYIAKRFGHRYVVGMDLAKALRNSGTPNIVVPERKIFIEPTLGDLQIFNNQYVQFADRLSCDIETDPWKLEQITCVGFSPSPDVALVIPFVDHRKPGWNYWPSVEQELTAWQWVKTWVESDIPKIGHNWPYDAMWFWKYGIKAGGVPEDTMFLHHALQPELPKSLGDLGSYYTNEGSWKNLVSFKQFKSDG